MYRYRKIVNEGGEMQPDTKPSYSYHPEVDYFPIATHPEIG